MKFLLRCPKCSNSMLYEPKRTPQKKACVYCGNVFNSRDAIIRASTFSER